MKKCILLSLFGLLSLVPKLQATHLMGGDIIVQQLSGLTYLVQLTTYRDTMGIPMQTTATFTFKNSSGTTILTTTTGYDTIISGNTLPMYPYGVEVYFFRDTVTLPSTGTFSVGWSDCCRNGAIQNLSSPLSESMFLQTDFTVDSIPNSTPFFLVPAAIFLPVNTPWQYNPLPFDPDGDSLYWSISSPLNGWNTPCAGFTIPPGSSANPITINPITGTISWTATTTGNFVFTVLVDEYRNGVHFGSIRRDMQFIVVTPNGQGPQWNVNIPTDSLGNLHINLVQFSSYQLNVMGYNPSGAPLYMQAYGEPFFTQPTPAVFTMQGQGINDTVLGHISWSPTAAQVRQTPYILVIRISDGYLTQDLSLVVTVSATVGEDVFDSKPFRLFPNPASSYIQLPAEVENATVMDASGRHYALRKDASGWSVEALPAGAYHLQAFGPKGEYLGSEKLIRVP